MKLKIKTSYLTGDALDWAVWVIEHGKAKTVDELVAALVDFRPSTDWAQGGPIIERERIRTEYVGYDFPTSPNKQWAAELDWYGPNPLIAAMRCYVASKLGDEVDVPEVLL